MSLSIHSICTSRIQRLYALLIGRIHVPLELLLEYGQFIGTIVFVEAIDEGIIGLQCHDLETIAFALQNLLRGHR